MPPWIKLLTGLVFALLLLALGAAALAPRLIDQQQLRRDLEAEIAQSMARPTRIKAIGRLRLLPTPSIRLDGVRLLESARIDAPTWITIDSLRLDADLWPLLSGRLVLAEVVLDRPRMRVPVASPQQRATVSHMAAMPTPVVQPVVSALWHALGVSALHASETRESGMHAPGASAPALPPIRRLIIRDGQLSGPATSPDGSALPQPAMPRIEDFNLSAGPLAPGQQGQLEATFTLNSEQPAFSMPGRAEAEIVLAEPPTELRLQPLRLRLGAAAGGQGLPIQIDTEVLIDLLNGRVMLDPFELLADGPQIGGVAEFYPTPVGLAADAQVQVPPFDLRRWLLEQAAIGVPGAADRLSHVGGQFELRLREAELTIDHAALTVDQTPVHALARLQLPQEIGAPVSGQLALAVDRLDLDPYLPGAEITTGTARAVSAAAAPSMPPSLPSLLPRSPEVEETEHVLRLQLSAGELRLGGLSYTALQLSGRVRADALELEARADVYGGHLEARFNASQPSDGALGPRGEISGAGTRAAPALRLAASASAIDVAALLSDLQPDGRAQAPVTGLAEIELDLVGRATDPQAMLDTLGGEAAVVVRDGAVTMVDLGQLIIGTVGAMGVSREETENLTRFSILSLTATGADGRFHSDDIQLRSNLLHIDGSGQLELPTQQIALDLQAVMTKPPKGRGIKELEGIPIPISAKGPWADPRWEVDIKTALDQAARRALREDSDLLDALEERSGIKGLGDGLRQILPGLLGQ